MSSDPDAPNSADSAVGRLVESFLARFRSGERPALAVLLAAHPELAEQLREIIPALVELEQLGGATGPFSGSRADGVAVVEANRPEYLGDYKILGRIGGGGMGVVYEAEHQSLRSRVALKVMHPRFRADEKYLRRFHIEARSAAGLHHTNIVSVFDYGEQGGVCYYAMQYIRGQPLDRVLEDLRRLGADRDPDAPGPRGAGPTATTRTMRSVAEALMTGGFASAARPDAATAEAGPVEATLVISPRAAEREAVEGPEPPREPRSLGHSSLGGSAEGRYYREVARVGAQVADALEYAHLAGVLHRDIKPSNLLLDALGNVWVTDFGLAKLVEGGDVSQSQDLVGTLRYMAPERFRGISNRSGDVYALGATLYELITLRPAFDDTDQLRLIDRIVHEPPERPRSIDRHVPRDLETIVLKALAKDPKDRFGSAGELAEELRKFVSGHPIRSRRISPFERFYRWCKRNPWLAAASIAAAATTIALAIGSTIAAKVYHDDREQIAAVARDLARSEARAKEKLFESRVAQASASRFSRQVGQRFDSLEALVEAVKIGRELGFPADRFDRLRDEAVASLMLPDLKPAGPPISLPEATRGFAFDDGMTRYAFRQIDGTIVVRHFGDDREIARFHSKGDREIWVFAFSPDGRYVASRDGDTISVWDVDRKSLAWTVPGVCKNWGGCFSPDSRRIAVSPRDGTILVYDLAIGQSRSWSGPEAYSMTYRPDGSEIAVIHTATCQILDAETGRQRRSFPIPSPGTVAWSLDGSTLAIPDDDHKIALFSAARSERGATLEGLYNGGIYPAFHPTGTLLASNNFEGRLRLWDLASGRERLSLASTGTPSFSKDGRIFIRQGDEFSPWQVDPAVEYTTLRYASNQFLNHGSASIHRDGRILAVGTNRGVILWDLARKMELGFLPIGMAWHGAFEPSGDLLTNGSAGVLRWAIRRDPTSGEVRIGPPRSLPLRGTSCGVAVDRTGRIVAVAGHQDARVALGDRTITIGPLDDCRRVSLSPDGKWLTTNNHTNGGVTIWSLPDGARVRRLPIEGEGRSQFSPDGKWLVTWQSSCRIWEVGSWREVQQFEGTFLSFSPDGRLGVVQDKSNVLGLVEIETGRSLARLERPDPQPVGCLTFSPDGSRLVATTNEPPSTPVIDLRAIRRRLATMGLDWDAPSFSEDDPARSDLPPLPPIQVDYGFLTPHLEHFSEGPEPLVARYTERIKRDPDDFDAYHHRAHALVELNRPAEALEDISRAILLHPNDVHFLHLRGQLHARAFKKWGPAIADLEAALSIDPSRSTVRELLAECCNGLAWELAASPSSGSNLDRALKLSERAVELAPGRQVYLNTRGVVLYRAGRFAGAVTVLEQSLKAGQGDLDGFDLYFLVMAHHRLGHREEARRYLDRAIEWTGRRKSLAASHSQELAAYRAEAEAVLAGPIGELPDDVIERPEAEDRATRP